MYAIRVQVDEGRLEVRASGHVAPEEALRAVSQAFALAEAGGLTRATCDLSEVTGGSSGIVVLGAAFASRFEPVQQLAIICAPRQLSFCRRLTRLSGFGENVGLFTREADAFGWLAAARRTSELPSTTRRHLSPPAADAREKVRRPARAAS